MMYHLLGFMSNSGSFLVTLLLRRLQPQFVHDVFLDSRPTTGVHRLLFCTDDESVLVTSIYGMALS